MTKLYLFSGLALLLGACSNSVDVDAASALPGSWQCDDGIVATFDSNGRYEWRVPAYDDTKIFFESNEQVRMNDDGGYSILDKWRLDAGKLEMDMFGEADRYDLSFKSETNFRMVGTDTFSCERQ